MERLIDRAADEMGLDRLSLRKRNFIKPSQIPMPPRTASPMTAAISRRVQQGARTG
jgi:CO/xanthine dehydrogenase Mo-binding subunit